MPGDRAFLDSDPDPCNCYSGAPDVASSAPDRLDVVVHGRNGEELWWKPYRSGQWLSGRQVLSRDGRLLATPGIASPATGKLYVFSGIYWSATPDLQEAVYIEPPSGPGN